jgi:hypothetical protein
VLETYQQRAEIPINYKQGFDMLITEASGKYNPLSEMQFRNDLQSWKLYTERVAELTTGSMKGSVEVAEK